MGLNIGVVKAVVIALLLVLMVLFVALAATRRDSRYYHWIAKVVGPVSAYLLPRHSVDNQPKLSVENFADASMDKAWKWFQPELISTRFANNNLVVDSKAESVWWKNQRGPMLYRYFEGDGDASVIVKTRKASDSSSYPDTEWQFGGLIFRDPISDAWFGRENYVFNVLGYRRKALQVEIKSTRNGNSDVSAFDWPTGDAELAVQRRGAVFTLRARPIGSADWQTMGAYTRPDLPAVLQLGVVVYSYSEGRGVFDLSVSFDNLQISSLSVGN